MKFSYNWLKEYVPHLPPAQKLASQLTLKSFEVEKIEKRAGDFILEINLPPNRFSDASGHLGLAKEISAILDIPFKLPSLNLKEGKQKASNFVNVKIVDKNDCYRYSARVIFDVQVKESPKWLKQKLETCGLQSINNVVDATNYVMLLTGQPLHAFDYDKLTGKNIKTIIVRRAKNNEKIETLDDRKISLDKDILLIADLKNPLAIAGIKGGKIAEIDAHTKRIVLESANFNPSLIRKASRKVGITTDASLRFERTISPLLTTEALDYVASLIQQLAGGRILKGIIDVFPQKFTKKVLGFNFEKFYHFIGFTIDKKFIEKKFESLGFKIIKKSSSDLFVEIPPHRIDIERFEDLAEEILRLYDYNKTPALAPVAPIKPINLSEEIVFRNKIKDILTNYGVDEVYSYAFISLNDIKAFNLNEKNVIALENPISNEYTHLQPTLIINLLKIAELNLKFYEKIKIFTIGKTFQKAPVKPFEEWRLAIALATKNKKDDTVFFELKGVIESLIEALNCHDVSFEDANINWFIKNRSAIIKSDNLDLGYIGQIIPALSHKYTDGFNVFICELDIAKLLKLSQEEYEFTPLPKYPAVIRDISILVDLDIRLSEILNVIYESEPKILFDVDLFDIYEGENLPENKKSLSFHLVFQADDHTLTSEEVGKALEKIISNLKNKLGAEIR
ncbi:MAG: phenylalanine--tRNA ligase subunit beta [Patescibacteria group bacterium]|jgi:phenylalanyl-tRNA synthetase beta chain|nr:phenylalanine--tRNA ligase subunit beta [Patescibacteria group bacterium]